MICKKFCELGRVYVVQFGRWGIIDLNNFTILLMTMLQALMMPASMLLTHKKGTASLRHFLEFYQEKEILVMICKKFCELGRVYVVQFGRWGICDLNNFTILLMTMLQA